MLDKVSKFVRKACEGFALGSKMATNLNPDLSTETFKLFIFLLFLLFANSHLNYPVKKTFKLCLSNFSIKFVRECVSSEIGQYKMQTADRVQKLCRLAEMPTPKIFYLVGFNCMHKLYVYVML